MRRPVFLSGVVGVLLLRVTPALAQTIESGFALNRFEPSERNNEWFVADTLDLRGHVRPSVGLSLDGQYRPIAVYAPDGSVVASPVSALLTAHVGGALNLWERVRVGVNVPVVAYQDGDGSRLGTGSVAAPSSAQAVGDVRLGADARIFGQYGQAATLALGAQLWLPTGDPNSYSSDGNVRVMPRVTIAGDVGPVVYSARIGAMFGRPERYFAATKLGQELSFAAAAGLRALDGKLVVGPEVFGSAVILSDVASSNAVGLPENTAGQTAVEAMLGAHYTHGALRFGLGGGGGLTRGLGAPTARGLLSFEWAPGAVSDADGDGILDAVDACPAVRGVATSDPKTHGCPPDKDGDGIADADDACVDAPGLKSEDPKMNGCPSDRDKDGILDTVDACVDVAGIKSTDPKVHGCPSDKDNDGVPDAQDACVDVPGVKTNDAKTNGCPADKDFDGIPDAKDACVDVAGVSSPKPEFNGCPSDIDADLIPNDSDACPREAGKPNKDASKNGCPTAYVSGSVIKILDQVKFKTSSAEILPGKDSEEILQAVLAIVKDHPEIKKLAVEGHTDSNGNAAMNKKLSANRAASVVTWLTSHGVDAARLSSAGFGPDRPIADNKTEDGRRQNRRVEFHIVGDDGAKSTTITSPDAPKP